MRRLLLLSSVLLTACPGPVVPPVPTPATGLVINEVVARNDSGATDPADPECPEFDDWVELYNAGDGPVDLDGVELTDGGQRLALPDESLAAGDRLLIWADGQTKQGPLHALFGVSAAGERLELHRGEALLDRVDVPPAVRDHSWARLRDGSGYWVNVGVPTPDAPNHRVFPDDPCFAPPADGEFDDHSFPCISTEESYLALAGDRSELRIIKFDVFDFGRANQRVRYVDSDFYVFHDQYFLFSHFNGQPFGDLNRFEPFDGQFWTMGELEAWAHSVQLEQIAPTDLARFAGERLFSRYFYDSINGDDRTVGVGTVVHRPATADREAFWGFELEYRDDIDYDSLVTYFELLAESGPPEFSDIRWLIRSPHQEELAQRMESEGLPYAGRATRYAELATPGEVAVYNPGLTAGRVRLIRFGEPGLDESEPTDLLVVDEIPDYLPPCAALLTSVPQTPLSHISLLARSRGIPNIYVAGITSDPEWDSWNRVNTRVVVEATPDGFRAAQMPRGDYEQWRELSEPTTPELTPVDPSGLPWAYDLASAPPMAELRPVVGGKAAGLRQLLTVDGLDAPDTPMGVSIKGYHEHMEQLDWLPALLTTTPFVDADAVRERYLALEGRAAYDERYPTSADAAAANTLMQIFGVGTPFGDVARGDGLRGAVQAAAMPASVQAAIDDAVEQQFGWLDPAQGLRFRSSSTVEDVEGFNGAGLYTSTTGFREPAEGQRSVSDAVATVWASYWGAEAFEERNAVGLRHTDGGMGLLVHPRFDDEFELANAVLTASIAPDGSHEVLVNAQAGAISVANPPRTCPPVLPEQVRLSDETGSAVIERLAESTELPSGVPVLSHAELVALFEASVAAVDGWLEAENAALPDAQRRTVLTLDLEARAMAAGWAEGAAGDRLVIKQARSLEPSVAGLPEDVRALPAPRDLLARAASVDAVECVGDGWEATLTAATTDPLSPPDLGFSEAPFAIEATLRATAELPELGWSAGQSASWDHTEFAAVQLDGVQWSVELADGELSLGDEAWIELPDGVIEGPATCAAVTLWASPDLFLLSYLP